jgi:hypothetical protein
LGDHLPLLGLGWPLPQFFVVDVEEGMESLLGHLLSASLKWGGQKSLIYHSWLNDNVDD